MSNIIGAGKDKSWNGCNYRTTGNLSVDMVINCVNWYRERKRPLKSITLSNYHYDRMDDYFRLNHIKDEELADENNETRKYKLDGINIERAGMLYVKDLSVEFWPTFRPEEHLFENRAKIDFSGLEAKMADLAQPNVKIDITRTK